MNTPPEPVLPPEPERPDCCGGGCAVCVLDGYFEELLRWRQQVEELRRQLPSTEQPGLEP